jgi:hypothetical protein
MAYLRYFDYLKSIQDVNIQQIISQDDSIRLTAEAEAQAEVISYLIQKYDIQKEFTDTTIWSPLTVYYGNNLVELNYLDYTPSKAYVINDLATQLGNCYICTANTTGVFDSTKWTLLGKKFDLFYITLPNPEFYYKNLYNTGTTVWWKNKNYTALKPSQLLTHDTALQYAINENLPSVNVFPDDNQNGTTYWGTGTTYSVSAGTLPTNTAKWTKGDSRSVQIVQKVVDICLYHLHSRIAPRNIPALRDNRYKMAIEWLQMAGQGQITADIPLLQTKTDGGIRWGSQVKRINDY